MKNNAGKEKNWKACKFLARIWEGNPTIAKGKKVNKYILLNNGGVSDLWTNVEDLTAKYANIKNSKVKKYKSNLPLMSNKNPETKYTKAKYPTVIIKANK